MQFCGNNPQRGDCVIRGVSKQIIVVEGSKQDFFEDAIFILKEDCLKEGIGEKDLLRQAKNALGNKREQCIKWNGALWALGGFCVSFCLWLLTVLL